jgi:hypothetical protein
MAMAKLVSQRFVWPAIQKDCRTWTRACQPCQRSNVSRHTITSVGDFPLPPARFLHIHIELVGPLPSSAGFQYCLPAVELFTPWLPISDIIAGTVSHTLLSGWISGFVVHRKSRPTMDDSLNHSSSSTFRSCEVSKSAGRDPIIPLPRAFVERQNRKLKAKIMCNADKQWIEALPAVLLGIARLLGGSVILLSRARLWRAPAVPGELLVPATPKVEASLIIQQRRRHMDQLRPTPAARYSPRPHSSTRIYGTRPPFSYGRTPYATPWNHHTADRTKSFPALTKHLRLSCAPDNSPY